MIKDWNVVVTVPEGGFARARALLEEFGPVSRTEYFNVLVMKIDDPCQLLKSLQDRADQEPAVLDAVASVLPVTTGFSFQSPEEFEARARDAALSFVPALVSKSFHVRMHRHGFKGRLSSHDEERLLGQALLAALEKAGTPGRITFQSPDAILAVETLSNRAGLSLWRRGDLQRYPLLKLD